MTDTLMIDNVHALAVANVISATEALTNVLEQETHYLETMQIGKVEALQHQKLKLAAEVEKKMLFLKKNSDSISGMSLADKETIRQVNARFETVSKGNYQKLMVARAVNKIVVDCVTSVYANKGNAHAYNAKGNIGSGSGASISLTLNKMI